MTNAEAYADGKQEGRFKQRENVLLLCWPEDCARMRREARSGACSEAGRIQTYGSRVNRAFLLGFARGLTA